MTSADNNLWITVDLNLTNLELATGLDVKLSNRPVMGDDGADVAGGRYYPILRGFSGVGADCRGALPKSGTGSIILSDENGQFDNFRKFSDILQRYTAINTTATIKVYHGPEDDNDVRADLSTIWTANVQQVRREVVTDSFNPEVSYSTIELVLQSRGLESKVVTKEINSENFTSAPTKSLGKTLPIVFGGDRQVRGYRVTADAGTNADYAYATTFGTKFENKGVQTYYVRDDTGKYVPFSGAASTSTELNGYALDANKASDVFGDAEIERAYKITPSSTYIITQGHFYMYAAASSQSNEGVFNIREDDNGVPGRVIRQAKFDFSNISGTGEHKIEFAFSKPLVMDSSKVWYFGYAIGWGEADVVSNGDFSSGSTGWTTEAGWSISGGKASYSGSSTTNKLLSQVGILQEGDAYEFRATVSNFTGSGRAGFNVATADGSKASRTITADGTIECFAKAKQSDLEFFARADSGSISFDVDDIQAFHKLDQRMFPYTSTVDNTTMYRLEKASGPGGESVWGENTTAAQPYFALYGLATTDTATGSGVDRNGLGYSKVALTQKTAPTNYTAPDLDDLSLILEIDGLADDSSGTLTGTSNQRIEYIDNVLQLLQYEYNGSTWVDNLKWDFAEYASTYVEIRSGLRYREVDGATRGRVSFEGLVGDICSNQATRIVMLNNGKFAPYCWGEEQATAKVLTDDEVKIKTVNWLGTETVVNSATINYGRRIIDADVSDAAAEGQFSEYESSVRWEDDTSTETAELTGQSRTIYGVRELAQTNYPWVAEDTTAEAMARHFLGVYRHSHIYVTLETPLVYNTDLEIMDVIELVSPEMSAYLGSAGNAGLPYYDDDEVDLILGHHWKRAQRYRVQIEGKSISWSANTYPVLYLTCRVLNNYPHDPT